MPTFDIVSAQGESDMGWAVSHITARHPVTGEPTTVTVTCKACLVTFEYRVDQQGGVASGFKHTDDCPILAGIHAHTVHDLKQGRH